MNALKPLKCYCPRCRQVTNHEVMAQHDMCSDEDDYWWKTTFSIVKCKGCENIQFHKEDWDESNFSYDEFGNQVIESNVSVYPKGRESVEPIDTWSLPSEIRGIYYEALSCLNQGLLRLAAAGFRSVVDAFCKYENIQGKSLEVKINNLAKKQLITYKDRDHLHTVRFMGNDTVHAEKEYDKADVIIVAHIINAMLTSVYVIEKEVGRLRIVPVKEYDDFKSVLESKLKNFELNTVHTLRNIIRGERRIISEDIPKWEQKLIEEIQNNLFTKLEALSCQSNQPQQYKILAH